MIAPKDCPFLIRLLVVRTSHDFDCESHVAHGNLDSDSNSDIQSDLFCGSHGDLEAYYLPYMVQC